jgi:hypothetical protein
VKKFQKGRINRLNERPAGPDQPAGPILANQC